MAIRVNVQYQGLPIALAKMDTVLLDHLCIMGNPEFILMKTATLKHLMSTGVVKPSITSPVYAGPLGPVTLLDVDHLGLDTHEFLAIPQSEGHISITRLVAGAQVQTYHHGATTLPQPPPAKVFSSLTGSPLGGMQWEYKRVPLKVTSKGPLRCRQCDVPNEYADSDGQPDGLFTCYKCRNGL